jgi:REP element-mobilizing transposase RayT
MTYARQSLISLTDTPYYHVVARCVRRAWLWGVDEYAGRDYSHRKAWVLERLRELASTFAIDVCAYAVMSNHYHLVLHIDRTRALRMTPEEVVRRWSTLFSAPPVMQRWLKGEAVQAEAELVNALIATWRVRLHDISWFMKCLNEHLARRANAEDECTGRFWEGRFRSQALLDEAGLLTALAYVDLNPIRAGIASTPEQSEFTSIYARIAVMPQHDPSHAAPDSQPPVPLRPFLTATRVEDAIPYRLDQYVELLHWSGRAAHPEKRGSIPPTLPPLLQRLNIDAEAWTCTMRPSANVFGRAMGQLDHLRLHAKTLGQSWVRGLRQAERLYGR